jgi:hypothetical protein
MKDMNGIKIIGVDHGYGNIKTANCCFLSGVAAFDEKPPVGYDLLLYDGRYYLIGALHKTYSGVKVIDGDYYILTLAAITAEAKKYADGVFKRLAERGYDPKQMRLYVVGGGGCILRNFGAYDASRMTVIDDLCATAKGYEFMAESRVRRRGGLI